MAPNIENNLFYYTLKDFEGIRREMLSLCEATFTLRQYVDGFHRRKRPYHTSVELLDQLKPTSHSSGPVSNNFRRSSAHSPRTSCIAILTSRSENSAPACLN